MNTQLTLDNFFVSRFSITKMSRQALDFFLTLQMSVLIIAVTFFIIKMNRNEQHPVAVLMHFIKLTN